MTALQGLDRVVAAAGAHGLRLVLTLTNYLPAYGGAPQWVRWNNGTSIADFWTSPRIRCSQSTNGMHQHCSCISPLSVSMGRCWAMMCFSLMDWGACRLQSSRCT